jgi:glutamyl-tRNA synthetase
MTDQAKSLLTPETKSVTAALVPELAAITEWAPQAIETIVRGFAERSGLKLGAVAQPLRAALTGRTTSPPIFDVLTVLGKDESLARLRDQIG